MLCMAGEAVKQAQAEVEQAQEEVDELDKALSACQGDGDE